MRRTLFTNNYPLASAWNLAKEFDSFFSELSNTPLATKENPVTDKAVSFQPVSEIKETNKGYLMSFDIPGVKEEDVKIEFKDHILRVYGERKEENKIEKEGYSRTEKIYGRFERSFKLPESVDENKIEANYAGGVLQVYLPKQEIRAAKEITIGKNNAANLSEKLVADKKDEAH